MRSHPHYNHNNSHEISFINRLGKFSPTRKTRVQLLRGYLRGCSKRVNWGNIDKSVVMSHAADALFREGKNA